MTDPRELVGVGRFIDPAVIHAAARDGAHRYPYAVWTPLPETVSQPRIDTTTFVLHSMAGPALTSLEAISRYYMRTDITGEPTWALDLVGRACQYMATDQRADNNAQANRFAASVETQDRGAGTLPVTPWTDAQVAQLAGMAAFLHLAEGVPLRRPDRYNSGGVDGHRAFPEWSIYVGKTCPGDARWDQIPAVIELATTIAAWTPTPEPPDEEDDMAERIYLGRLKDDPDTNHDERYHLRAGRPPGPAVVYRANENNRLKKMIDEGRAPEFFHPGTNERIGSWAAIREFDETDLDLLVGYPDWELTLPDEG